MSIKEGQEFYRSLSRKELQSLCKKYGLPARKSSSEMAESLFSFFQKNDLSLASLGKSRGGIQEVLLSPSSVTNWQTEAPFSLTGNVIKDSFRQRSCPREEGNKGNRNTKCNEMESCVGLGVYDKEAIGGSIDHFQGSSLSQTVLQSAGGGVIHKEPPSSLSGRLEDTPQFHCGHINVGVCPIKNVSPARTYRKVSPSFEFYVSSEEGIKLCVDLNSSPLDWIKDYKNQVSLCKNAGGATSRSLHQELGCIGESDNTQIKGSFPHSVNPGEIEDGRVQVETFPSLVMENNIEIDHPDGGNQSSMILPTRPCSVEGLECLGEEQGPISSKTSSGVQNQIISNAEFCAKNGCSAILDSDIINVPTEKTACNFAVNSISDGSVDLIAIEHQNSKHDDEICETLTRQNNSDIENNCIVFPGCLASCSAEMQLSEAGNYHKDTSSSPNKNGEFLRLDDSRDNAVNEQAALATSSENDHCGNHLPTCSEEQEWNNIVNVMESSICSQVDNSIEKTCFKSNNQESNEEFCRKRPFIGSECQNCCSKHDAKILRSMKYSTGEALPRRSMRLVSKGSTDSD
ncbi:uncharacterized protein LOC110651660 isoform X1 [Hevea brasiliensis]|uniref:uncharacterized protein LOC110651660 isoform X1 n=2 Tax=Hevea brasiliensis TaxID=3981 RepID=UPI0025ED740D|nr:uncharacterized protein LOC110651660 isoform X1 [Hevea brasiliensis]